jgi:nucleotide-binding universal stress UspA family protein
MQRILLATDRTEGSRNAMARACRIAAETGAELRIVHSVPEAATSRDLGAIRAELGGQARRAHVGRPPGEIEVSIRLPSGNPAEAILAEARLFDPDLVILGSEGEFGMRQVFFGTTATHVARDSRHPVLVVQTEAGLPYSRILAAIDDDTADKVLRLAGSIASASDLFVVHAFGSATQALFGYGDVIEDVRSDQEQKVEHILRSIPAGSKGERKVHVHNIVEAGEVISVIMRAWTEVEPDLVVIGTHGRRGLAWLSRGSYAETVLLGCPSDILVAPASRDGDTQ